MRDEDRARAAEVRWWTLVRYEWADMGAPSTAMVGAALEGNLAGGGDEGLERRMGGEGEEDANGSVRALFKSGSAVAVLAKRRRVWS